MQNKGGRVEISEGWRTIPSFYFNALVTDSWSDQSHYDVIAPRRIIYSSYVLTIATVNFTLTTVIFTLMTQ